MCKTVLIAGLLVRVLTTKFSPVIFIELLKLFCEVLFSGKIEKNAPISWKNSLIVFIHRLNVHLCSNLKCYFKSA